MAFNIDVDAKLCIKDGQILLSAAGLVIDISKCDTIDECRLSLIGLATHCLTSNLSPSRSKNFSVPINEAPVQTVESTVGTLGKEFQDHQDSLRRQQEELRSSLAKQYEDLTSQYETTVESLGLNGSKSE